MLMTGFCRSCFCFGWEGRILIALAGRDTITRAAHWEPGLGGRVAESGIYCTVLYHAAYGLTRRHHTPGWMVGWLVMSVGAGRRRQRKGGMGRGRSNCFDIGI
jgi:hypothetical protein